MYALGEIALLCDIARPQVGVVTNCRSESPGATGTIERIAQAKTELVQALPPESEAAWRFSITMTRWCGLWPNKPRPGWSLMACRREADLWASDVTSAGLEGIRFVFHYQGETIHVRVPMLGRHSVHAALRAALVGLVEGWPGKKLSAAYKPCLPPPNCGWWPCPARTTRFCWTTPTTPARPRTIAALNLLDDLSAPKKSRY